MPDLLTILNAYWVTFMIVLVASMALRHLTAVRTLRQRGAANTTGLWTFSVYAEMRSYKELCEREGRSLRWWRLWWGLHITLWVALAGGLALVAYGAPQ